MSTENILCDLKDYKGLTKYLIHRAIKYPDDVVCMLKKSDWVSVTALSMMMDVLDVAGYFINRGIIYGDRIGIMGKPRYEWVVTDLALALIGIISVPIYETNSMSQVNFIKENTLLSDIIYDEELKNIITAANKNKNYDYHSIIMMANQVEPDTLLTISYTSGTSNLIRGVELTHRNLISTIDGICNEPMPYGLIFELGTTESSLLQFLPLSHILSRSVTHMIINSRARVAFCPEIKELFEYLNSFHPTFLVSVPFMLEKVYQKIYNSPLKLNINIFIKILQKEHNGYVLSFQDKLLLSISRSLLKKALKKKLGGRLKSIVVGGAALAEDIELIFRNVGIEIFQGYGMTETSGPIAYGRPHGKNKLRSVGKVLSGNEISIDDNGEIMVRGSSVTLQYYLGEKIHGWFHTNDIGHFDENGYLYIDGRKDAIIVTKNGINLNPVPIEQQISLLPFVRHAILIGNHKPYITLLVSVGESCFSDEEIEERLKKICNLINSNLSHAESIRDFRITREKFTLNNNCLSVSYKVRRHIVEDLFTDLIDEMYQ